MATKVVMYPINVNIATHVDYDDICILGKSGVYNKNIPVGSMRKPFPPRRANNDLRITKDRRTFNSTNVNDYSNNDFVITPPPRNPPRPHRAAVATFGECLLFERG